MYKSMYASVKSGVVTIKISANDLNSIKKKGISEDNSWEKEVSIDFNGDGISVDTANARADYFRSQLNLDRLNRGGKIYLSKVYEAALTVTVPAVNEAIKIIELGGTDII